MEREFIYITVLLQLLARKMHLFCPDVGLRVPLSYFNGKCLVLILYAYRLHREVANAESMICRITDGRKTDV